MKRLVAGILAHVDAGKTTLSEALLFLSGTIRTVGRVDHGDAYLDTYALEKERGITIFSKQAVLKYGDTVLTLLDTPGHVDFSAEMERTLQVLDAAILVISGPDGVQGHTRTLWKLLKRYDIPVFLFVNKMDQPGTDRERIMDELRRELGESCVDFSVSPESDAFLENVSLCDEKALSEYLESGTLQTEAIQDMIKARTVFPCYFGSARTMEGTEDLLGGFCRYAKEPPAKDSFSGRVYKISRDDKGSRLTFLKITGGRLCVKDLLSGTRRGGNGIPPQEWEDKVDQIRLYSGAGYEALQEAVPGMTVALTGLKSTMPGDALGAEEAGPEPYLEPVLDYRIILPEGADVHQSYRNLLLLSEEDPSLQIVMEEHTREIHARLMGDVQIEILRSLILERFHLEVSFGAGSVVYRETIVDSVEGVGHFEPLRHYAEVHLLLEPGERGSGLRFFTSCSEDVLDRNWQRLILTHLMEREHPGVLIGAPVTDMQITLLTGRAHLKHTEGGDFRQATYRAVRQGLRKAKCILLEPVYDFLLEIPAVYLGRAMTDIRKMQGHFEAPQQRGEEAVLTGSAPVSAMRDYQSEVNAYTKGSGRLSLSPGGYEPCPAQDEIVSASGYDPDRDPENPTGSVFCAHGAGFNVSWDQVEDYMHLESAFSSEPDETEEQEPEPAEIRSTAGTYAEEKELQEIFERTFGPVKRYLPTDQKRVVSSPYDHWKYSARRKKQEEYLLVDGYNIIFAWDELKSLAKTDIHAAQERLKEILSDYQGITGCRLILVFDAYRVEGHREEIFRYHNIHVVFTKEAETADQYIEKTAHHLAGKNRVTVATSDGLEQIIIMGQGAQRLSAMGLFEEIQSARANMKELLNSQRKEASTYLMDIMPEDVSSYLE